VEKWHQAILLVALGLVGTSAVIFFVWIKFSNAKGWKAHCFRLVTSFAGGLLVTASIAYYWYHHRLKPKSIHENLFPSITYIREVTAMPRPLVIHTLTIQLNAPGVSFFVTPGDPKAELPLRARTTSEFAREFQVQIALNGDFFSPWYSNSPWDYYPHGGDLVCVQGIAASEGVVYSNTNQNETVGTLYLSIDNRGSFVSPTNAIFNAISGRWLIRDGELSTLKNVDALEPRTAIGLDRDGGRLIVIIVDGRQPNYSEGVTLLELAGLLRTAGAYESINLDGGGSSALVAETAKGKWESLNCPIHTRLPWRERPVANHLGIRLPSRR
jgi:hypothetical protein